ncbi:MAG TPA: hypothetical protein VMU75_11230 [Acidimicrobiales bacterium]|nr:hypothetical protein [Acidimicrobiales bacterium]
MTDELALDPGEPAFDADEVWPTRATARRLRLPIPAVVLLALLLAAGGFWAGAAVQKSRGAASGTSRPSGLASLFGRGGAASGSGLGAGRGLGGASTAAAAGIVTVVEGTTLYVTTASGGLVKVLVGPQAKVTRDAGTTLSTLKPGDTVVVQGTKAKNGTVSASSISATAAGVSAGFGAALGGGSPGGSSSGAGSSSPGG